MVTSTTELFSESNFHGVFWTLVIYCQIQLRKFQNGIHIIAAQTLLCFYPHVENKRSGTQRKGFY